MPAAGDGYLRRPAPAWARNGGPGVIVVLVERGGAMIATRPDTGIFASHGRIQTQSVPLAFQENFHDQRQRRASRGGSSSAVERAGTVHQGPVVRKSERAGLAGAATAATRDQYPDQRHRQQSLRKRIRSDAVGRRQGGKRRQGDVQLRSGLCRGVPHCERSEGKPASAGDYRISAVVVPFL